jgi:lysophospholipase L1-like esterase
MRKGGTYLALGDSITFGSSSGSLAEYTSYPSKTAKAIRDNYGRCRLLNKAISGWKTVDFLTNQYYWSRIEADLITLHIGQNDIASSVTTADFQANLEKIVDLIKDLNPNTEIILCSISRRSDAYANNVDPYRTVVANVAASRGLKLCKFEDAWLQADTATYTTDGLHPNAAGHSKLYDVLYPVIQTTNFVQQL